MHATFALSVMLTVVINGFSLLQLLLGLLWVGYGVPFISVIVGVITGLYSDPLERKSRSIGFLQGFIGSFIAIFIIPFLLGFLIGMFYPEFFGIDENSNMGLEEAIEDLFYATIAMLPLCISSGICSMIGYCHISTLLSPSTPQQSNNVLLINTSGNRNTTKADSISQKNNQEILAEKKKSSGLDYDKKKVSCTFCQQVLKVPSSYSGTAECPSCKHQFEVKP
jgi:MFS family permease